MSINELMPWNWGKKAVPVRRETATNDPFVRLQQEMNRLFEDFTGGALLPLQGGGFSPRVDVRETEDAIRVSAELPGMREDDLDLKLTDDCLTIAGEKQEEKSGEKDGFSYTERSFGSFRRDIPLPAGVDAEKVEATFKNGVLEITVPKSAEAKDNVKQIPVQRG